MWFVRENYLFSNILVESWHLSTIKTEASASNQGWAENSTPGIYRWNLPVFPGVANKAQVANNGKYNFLQQNTAKYDF